MAHSNNLCFDFGPYRMNATQRVLTGNGTSIPLTPKTTDILLVLLKNSGELVDKEALLSEVWPETFVEESNLTQYIFRLRQAIKDQRTPAQYIETIPGRGYRFIAPVKMLEIPSPADQAARALSALDRSDAPPRIAVIPFLNATGDDSFEYLSDGISENLINSLSQISTLRVMSRTAVIRFKGRTIDPKRIANELQVDAVLLGKITSTPSGLVMNVELVDAGNGWQLWGKSFVCELSEIVDIQQEVVKQISIGLRLRLTGDEEKRLSARYTDNPKAYELYTLGRYYWGQYTSEGIHKAIELFADAISQDPNYTLAYTAIIDCYLRLAVNYLPCDPTMNKSVIGDSSEFLSFPSRDSGVDPKASLRHLWDWKGAVRELRRANELRVGFPVAHLWHAAYLSVRNLCSASRSTPADSMSNKFPTQIWSTNLTENEEIQVWCAIAREQIAICNFRGARLILSRWLTPNGWPALNRLDSLIAADFLFTLGTLLSTLSLTDPSVKGQRQAESYLNGAIALFEHLGRRISSAEARIELGRCLFREGHFDESRSILSSALTDVPDDETELRSQCLLVLGALERHAGRLKDSLSHLKKAFELEASQLGTGRRHLEIATTLKELGDAENNGELHEEAKKHFKQALFEFEAIGDHNNLAATANNFGNFLLSVGQFAESEQQLVHALRSFEGFSDSVRTAQVNETLAQLYLATHDLVRAEASINRAVSMLKQTDSEAILAEALLTQGIINARLRRYSESKKSFESASMVAERCGDHNTAGLASLTMVEELGDLIEMHECAEIEQRLKRFLSKTPQSSLVSRLELVLQRISPTA